MTTALAYLDSLAVSRILLAVERWPEESDQSEIVPPTFLKSLRQGDQNAWRDLFNREMPAIFRYSLSRLGRPEDAEDVTNHVFEEAWKSIGRFSDRGVPLRAWLFGIARNLANKHRQRYLARNAHLSLEALDLERTAATSTDHLDLARALLEIEPGHAEVVCLRFVHGLSLEETAAVLKITIDGVKGRQKRALEALRRRLSN